MKYLSGYQISQRKKISQILRNTWQLYGPSVYMLNKEILNSDGSIIVAYEADPATILRSIRIDTDGSAENIPETFDRLTDRNTWKTHNPDGDSIVLVDLTTSPAYEGRGLAHSMIEYALEAAAKENEERGTPKHVYTYSPFIEKVMRMHERHGAKLARRIEKGRPGYHVEDVAVMRYF